ncbi:hypothetical protein BKA62DRAFT_727746, partial [Auriculariales sp. MPI-PUGE-AT-0066]
MVNIFSQSRSNDGLSTWDLLPDACQYFARRLAKTLVVELAIISHVSLAVLLAPDDDLAELLDILAGGDRGIQLALADTSRFVITASHGRVVSPQWWDNIKTQLQSLTEERWSKRGYKDQHATPQALVAEIEAIGPCEECATIIIEARKLLDARAAVDSTTTAPQAEAQSQAGRTNIEVMEPWLVPHLRMAGDAGQGICSSISVSQGPNGQATPRCNSGHASRLWKRI